MKVTRILDSCTRRGGATATLVVGMGLAGALGFGWWYAVQSDEAAAAVSPSSLIRVERREVIDGVTASGRVEPVARVAVMSRASGIIKELAIEEGDLVKEGQVLAELDREQLEAQLAQDEAELASAEARVAGAEARVSEARVRLNDPELEFLEREAQRFEELLARGDVAPSERDAAARALASSRFRIEQVKASLPVLEAAVREATANLDSAKAALERSQTALREATILSPIDGVVLVRSKEVGDGVSSILTAGGNATEVMTLGDLSDMFIEARVDEVDLGRIHVDMPALVTVDAFRGRRLVGKVERIAPAGSVDDNGIVTFEVRISVEDPDKLLRPDMTADAQLVINRRDDVPTLPQRALQRGPQGDWFVMRYDETTGQAAQVAVELGVSDGLMTEVKGALGEGDAVLLGQSRPSGGRRP